MLWAMCSLEAAYKLEVFSLHDAVPWALGTQEATVRHALHSLAGAVLWEVGHWVLQCRGFWIPWRVQCCGHWLH